MKVVVLVLGSRGDAVPMASLARELVGRRVPTTLVVLPELAAWAAGTGARVVAVGGDGAGRGSGADEAAGEGAGDVGVDVLRTVQGAGLGDGPLGYTRTVTAWLRSLAAPMAETTLATVEPGDVVIGGVLALDDLCALRQARGCLPVLTLMAPLHPTDDGAGSLLPVRPRGRTAANRWAGRLALLSTAGMCTTTGRELRARLGLPPTTARGFLRELPTVATLHATGAAVVPVPPDLPGPVWQTGFWAGDAAAADPGAVPDPDAVPPGVPAGLAAFLEAGEPPVLLGFGSMPSQDPDADVHLLARAARLAGVRAVVRRPPGPGDPLATPGPLDAPGEAFVIRDVPYGWLMPRVAAVVHHGGAGTLVAALRAGRPNVAVPFGADQPYYGRRLHELGAGPAPVPRRRLTAERLAAALTAMTRGPGAAAHRDAAARLGALLGRDPGVAAAAGRVAELVAARA